MYRSRSQDTGRPGGSRREPETILYASQILENVRNCRVAAASSYNSRMAAQMQVQLPRAPSPLGLQGPPPRRHLNPPPKHTLPINTRNVTSLQRVLASRQRRLPR